jgi:hypothetical protein
MGEGILLNGLVYLHRIVDPRISGTARSNMRLFRELCGNDNLNNVLLGTTFWTEVDDTIGQKREKQLLADPKFWKPMAEKGSRAFRLKGNRLEDLQILSHIAQRHGKFLIQAQEEMRLGQQMHETSAGRAMNLGLDQIKREYEAKISTERLEQQARIDEADRRRREEHRKEQVRTERQRRRNVKRLEREEARKDKERQESEARQALQQKMKHDAAEREMRQKLDVAAKGLREREAEATRLRQLSLHICKNYNTKRIRCNKCMRRLDLVDTGKWCYRNYFHPSFSLGIKLTISQSRLLPLQ